LRVYKINYLVEYPDIDIINSVELVNEQYLVNKHGLYYNQSTLYYIMNSLNKAGVYLLGTEVTGLNNNCYVNIDIDISRSSDKYLRSKVILLREYLLNDKINIILNE
jgi:hypothetical protein